MTSELFYNAQSQYIDPTGKTRILFYNDGTTLTVSPIPPLDVPENEIENIMNVTIDIALKFIRKYSLKITEKSCKINEDGITKIEGLWVKVNESITFGYIFIDDVDVEELKDIPVSEGVLNPILPLGNKSELVNIRKNYKIAEYLKHYSLVELAHYPKSFGEKNFSIKPNHNYGVPPEGIGSKLSRKNAYFYSGGKIVVHDEETRDRLILFATVASYNDPSIFEIYKTKKVIEGHLFYKSIYDFTNRQGQLLFSSEKDIDQWKNIIAKNIPDNLVSYIPLPDATEPYYYRNFNIENGRLMIIQNTKMGDFSSALAVSKKWEYQGINTGFNTLPLHFKDDIPDDISFEVYTTEGRTYFSYTDDSKKILKIFAYTYEEKSYGAVLFL